MVKKRYVVDTNCIISYYSEVFANADGFNDRRKISSNTRNIIDRAVSTFEGSVLLSVPSIVFIEIYEKWLRAGEFYRQFFYEVFIPIRLSPNIEIRAMDQEVLENLLLVDGCLLEHDLHDKIIVASAITLECPIITFDEKIREFVGSGKKHIPQVLN